MLEPVVDVGRGIGNASHHRDIHAADVAALDPTFLQLRQRRIADARPLSGRARERGVQRHNADVLNSPLSPSFAGLHDDLGTGPPQVGIQARVAYGSARVRKLGQPKACLLIRLDTSSVADGVVRVLIERLPRRRAAKLLGIAGPRGLVARTGEVVVSGALARKREAPLTCQRIVRVGGPIQACQRLGTAAHAHGIVHAVSPPSTLLGLVGTLEGTLLLRRCLGKALGRILHLVDLEGVGQCRVVTLRLLGKGHRTAEVLDSARAVGRYAGGGVGHDERGQRALEVLQALQSSG